MELGRESCIFVSAGHYPEVDGYFNAKLKLSEHRECYKIVKEIMYIGDNKYYKLVSPDSLSSKVDFINNESDCTKDLAIEIHLNSCPQPNTANGMEVLRYSNSEYGLKASVSVLDSMKNYLPFRNRGIKNRNDLYFLKHTRIAAIIIEVLFLNNDRDANYLLYDRAHITIARAIVEGIENLSRPDSKITSTKK